MSANDDKEIKEKLFEQTPPKDAGIHAPSQKIEGTVRRENLSFPSNDGETTIRGYLWFSSQIACGETPKGVVQLVHGMVEHAERYEEFAHALVKAGYVVSAHDQLGHGKSVKSEDLWGCLPRGRGAQILVDDVHSLITKIKCLFPNTPIHLFGHSMGSFIARIYAFNHAEELSSLIICGTGIFPEKMIEKGISFFKLVGKVTGEDTAPDILKRFTVGKLTGKFKGDGPAGWLTRDPKIREEHEKDPRTTFIFSAGAYHELMLLMQRSQQFELLERIPKTLPILIISGEDDHVGDYGKTPARLYEILTEEGFEKTRCILYSEMRHEIINEIGREEVYQDVIDFLDRATHDLQDSQLSGNQAYDAIKAGASKVKVSEEEVFDTESLEKKLEKKIRANLDSGGNSDLKESSISRKAPNSNEDPSCTS